MDIGIILKQQLKQRYAKVILGDTEPTRYLKWISFVPKHWNVEKIVDKDISLLTEQEQEILKRVKQDKEMREIFEKYLSSSRKSSKCVYDVYQLMQSINIIEYAESKLTLEELSYCNQRITQLENRGLLNSITFLEITKDRNMLEEYILLRLLEKRKINNNGPVVK